MVALGCKLRELRLSKEFSQRQVADRIGVTSSVISAYKNSIRLPSYNSLIKLAALFNVSTDYLLGVTTNPNKEGLHLICLDGLTPDKVSLVIQLVDALKT